MGTAAHGALIVWLLIFRLTGLFQQHFDNPSPRLRYLSDSSYWLFLMHPPAVLFFQLIVAPAAVGAFFKTALVIAASIPVLL